MCIAQHFIRTCSIAARLVIVQIGTFTGIRQSVCWLDPMLHSNISLRPYNSYKSSDFIFSPCLVQEEFIQIEFASFLSNGLRKSSLQMWFQYVIKHNIFVYYREAAFIIFDRRSAFKTITDDTVINCGFKMFVDAKWRSLQLFSFHSPSICHYTIEILTECRYRFVCSSKFQKVSPCYQSECNMQICIALFSLVMS